MRYFSSVVTLCFGLLILLGCSATQTNPLTPTTDISERNLSNAPQLWGFYEISIDSISKEIEISPNRSAMFTANVTNFMNGKPTSLGFEIKNIITESTYLEIDLDVILTHPFPGMTQYNGYDVRGVFIGNGSATMDYNPDLKYSVPGTDQILMNADGYTRWFNPDEFGTPGLFGYTPGIYATKNYFATATLNPYKYFADTLGANSDLWSFLTTTTNNGVFTSGSTNRRNYVIRFPSPDPGVKFSYAVIANWEGEAPEFHPSNAAEALALDVEISPGVYYVDPTNNGGSLIMDISVFDWSSQISAGVMEDYTIFIESTVLSAVHEFTPAEMTPVSGNETYSTYHVEIPADSVSGLNGNEIWVCVQYRESDYNFAIGPPNDAGDDYLTAFFRYDLEVSPNPNSLAPECNLEVVGCNPVHGWDVGGAFVKFDATGSSDPDGDPITFSWDFDGDGNFGESPDDDYTGSPDNPTHNYLTGFDGNVSVKVSDPFGMYDICSVPLKVIISPSKNISLHPTLTAQDIALDHRNGDLLVLYFSGGTKQVWKYSRCDGYTTGSLFYNLWAPTTNAWALDIAANGVSMVVGDYASANPVAEVYLADGTPQVQISHGGPGYPIIDTAAVTYAGQFEHHLTYLCGWPPNGGTFVLRCPDNNWFPPDWHYHYPTNPFTGLNQLYYGFVKGMESDKTSNAQWFIEGAPEFYASRWMLVYTSFPPQLVYDNAYFGTGSQSNADNAFYDPKDITRDDQNRLIVLDRLSTGQPRLKMWTVSGNTTTSKGGFGNSTSISGEPKKIDGCDWSGEIVVLHGSSAPYKISVFVPSEMPE